MDFKYKAKYYSQVLQKLHTLIKKKHPGQPTGSITLLHDKAYPHRS